MQRSYITTAIPYVNAAPHLGFALELVEADAVARTGRAAGEDVRFVAGTDDNALKNVIAAEKAGVPVREFVRQNAAQFRALRELLNLSYDAFIGTSEDRHIRGARKFWSACKKEDIYRKKYRGLYCVGCEEFKTIKEVVSGRCSEHPANVLQEIEEENYFFRLSRYAGELQKRIASNAFRITPESRRNEMLKFIESGLEDFSISRSVARAKGWGVPVPGDESQVMYVWFDALTNYLTVLGYADDDPLFKKYWEEGDRILHVVGKGISRFHAVYWPAMLLSANLRLPTDVFVHGYLTIRGEKISKSVGNVIHPETVAKQYGADAVRYYVLREVPSYEDGDFSEERFRERYNADLANGLGNFISRVLALGARFGEIRVVGGPGDSVAEKCEETRSTVRAAVSAFRFHDALAAIMDLVAFGDRLINEKKPWAEKNGESFPPFVFILECVGKLLEPFLPETSVKIQESITRAVPDAVRLVKPPSPFFPRLQ